MGLARREGWTGHYAKGSPILLSPCNELKYICIYIYIWTLFKLEQVMDCSTGFCLTHSTAWGGERRQKWLPGRGRRSLLLTRVIVGTAGPKLLSSEVPCPPARPMSLEKTRPKNCEMCYCCSTLNSLSAPVPSCKMKLNSRSLIIITL